MELEKSIENQNEVVLRLAKHVTKVADGSNLVFSPTSINVLLSLIAAGSSNVSKDQILSFLGLPSSDHLNEVLAKIVLALSDGNERSDLILSAAYGVWIDKSLSFKPSFKDLLENSYKATCTQVDFQTKPGDVIDEVNRWAEIHTNGCINQVLSHDSIETIRDSILILTNAMYFKGAWSEKFDAKLTKNKDFHLLNGKSVTVPFMKSFKDQYIKEYDGFKVLRLPYVNDHRQFSMYIYLPDAKDGLYYLFDRIVSESGFLDKHIPNKLVEVRDFSIPKFKFSFEFEASEVLKGMGLTSPFSGGNLTEMVESPTNLYVSKIVHKACIEVDEEGTEAAAVSVCGVAFFCIPDKYDFVADHPFIFTVREDKSGVVLFMGQVLNPSK